jgi:hypothetical protein
MDQGDDPGSLRHDVILRKGAEWLRNFSAQSTWQGPEMNFWSFFRLTKMETAALDAPPFFFKGRSV